MNYPNVIKVVAQDDYYILVYYENGEKKLFDVKPYIFGDWMGRLKDQSIFKSVHPNPFSPDTVQWCEGQDIAPHSLYEHGINVE